MLKKQSKRVYSCLVTTFILLTACGVAAESRYIKKSDLNSLKSFQFQQKTLKAASSGTTNAVKSPYVQSENSLSLISTVATSGRTVERYQQKYYGVEVFGSQITLDGDDVNGKVEEGIAQDITTEDIALYQSADLQAQAAKKIFGECKDETFIIKLIIYPLSGSSEHKYVLAYYLQQHGDSSQPTYIVDCKTQKVYKQWDSVNQLDDTSKCVRGVMGPGGNMATGKYFYGFAGLEPLTVPMPAAFSYTLDDGKVSVVDMKLEKSTDDEGNEILGPAVYWKGIPFLPEDYANGAYNVKADVYVFAQLALAMYHDWLDENVMTQKFILRVHYAKLECTDTNGDGNKDTCTLNKNYCNASWNGSAASFGDGDGVTRFPETSLDIVAHELSHAFTKTYSGLVYEGMSGALSESYSDIAAVTVMEYTRQKYPSLFNAFYSKAGGRIPWTIGEYIKCDGTPLRYLNHPAEDGVSADCYLAVDGAERTYQEVVEEANIQKEKTVNSWIVHKASGIFNRAFYLLAQRWGIEKAFRVFALANIKYWTSSTDFNHAAGGVVSAAQDYNYNIEDVVSTFSAVGVTPE